jgi:hypothetical protein
MRRAGDYFLPKARTRHVRSSTECTGNYVPQIYTLYQNRLSDDERFEIIKDSKRFTDCVSIIHMKGIANIDQNVTIRNNVKVKLRTLLLHFFPPAGPNTKNTALSP